MTPACKTLAMSKASLDRPGPWTEAEYLALDRASDRIELIDGRLQVSPGPTWEHQEISFRLHTAIQEAASATKLRVAEGVNVRLATDRLVIPDLVVADLDRRRVGLVTDAAEVILVAESTSPSNADTDRTRKMRLYEVARIPWYLLVEPDMTDYESIRLRLFQLQGSEYTPHAIAEHGEILTANVPFPLAIATTDLIRP
ncbi:hypothetical protein Ari01nite_46960 [Paractinoplanes rishiriensis]|uniref:Putative restriction endonuclease domain-containing protein n=2 Tax=Paractinoplanes rishiriensis TaxID=1050105 RepID=A0A919JXV6_9ACTN|nr:hypothetical protein Ari01nite_46960 [Actinoplanes rishiriensis]